MADGNSNGSQPTLPGTLTAVDGRRQNELRRERRLQKVIQQIEESLSGLQFGQVTITVQDGVVVQIDRLERTRVQRSIE